MQAGWRGHIQRYAGQGGQHYRLRPAVRLQDPSAIQGRGDHPREVHRPQLRSIRQGRYNPYGLDGSHAEATIGSTDSRPEQRRLEHRYSPGGAADWPHPCGVVQSNERGTPHGSADGKVLSLSTEYQQSVHRIRNLLDPGDAQEEERRSNAVLQPQEGDLGWPRLRIEVTIYREIPPFLSIQGKVGGVVEFDWSREIFLGNFINQQQQYTSSSTTAHPFSMFPLPFVRLPGPAQSSSSRSRQRAGLARTVAVRLNQLVETLNALHHGDLQPPDARTISSAATCLVRDRVNSITIRVMSNLLDQTWIFCRHLRDVAALMPGEDPTKVTHSEPVFHYKLNSVMRTEIVDMGITDEQGSTDQRPPATGLNSETGAWVPLRADRLALPGPGEGAVIPLLLVLPPHLQQLYSGPNESILRLPPPSTESLNAVRIRKGCDDREYGKVIRRIFESGMLIFSETAPLCVNAIFSVRKDEQHDRLITDARRANLLWQKPGGVDLASPSYFSDLIIPDSAQLFVGKSDVKNMFHRFRLPDWMIPYFGLMPVPRSEVGLEGDGIVWPCMQSLPMGFSHAVILAQSAHYQAIQESLVGIPNVLHRESRELSCVWMEYIDDHGVLSTSIDACREAMSASVSALEEKGMDSQPSKQVWPVAAGDAKTDLLGVTFRADGWLTPAKTSLASLLNDTVTVLQAERVTMANLSSIVGKWVWILLLNRPMLSILGTETFEDIAKCKLPNDRIVLPRHTRQELLCLIDLAPLIMVNLKTPLSTTAVATDASMKGAGVVTSPINREQWHTLAEFRERKGWYTRHQQPVESDEEATSRASSLSTVVRNFTTDSCWETKVSSPWKFPEDSITILELNALLLGIRNFLETESNHASRPLFFLDSTAALGAVAKGRSASNRVNHLCRKICAYLCAGALRPGWLWIPTDIMPADQPSRTFARQ